MADEFDDDVFTIGDDPTTYSISRKAGGIYGAAMELEIPEVLQLFNQRLEELVRWCRAFNAENHKLRRAIERAGFAIMQTSGDWSIHDVSELAEREQEKTTAVIAKNIELEIQNQRLRDFIDNELSMKDFEAFVERLYGAESATPSTPEQV